LHGFGRATLAKDRDRNDRFTGADVIAAIFGVTRVRLKLLASCTLKADYTSWGQDFFLQIR
jgi:hypothetical protein